MLRSIRLLAAPVALLAASLASSTANATVASAPSRAGGDLTCTASAEANFDEALSSSNTTANVDITGRLTNCESPNGKFTAIKSGKLTASGTATSRGGLNPCSLILTLTGTGTFDWDPTGSGSSSVEFSLNTNPGVSEPVLNFSITGGPLEGDSALPVIPVITPNTDCLFNGLKSLKFPLTVVTFA